jgi:hypothetical protein
MSAYQKHGYKDRNDYLSNAADEYGVDPYVVSCLADLLGEKEDFDGRINELEDYRYFEGSLA